MEIKRQINLDSQLERTASGMTAPLPQQPTFYRRAEVATMLRCSEWWVKEQARKRRIPYSWIGGSYLFTPEHLAEIIRVFEVRPANSVPQPRRSRGSAAPSADRSAEPILRLIARPPRRTRSAPSDEAA
jgi:hypothetical protein